MPLAGKTHPSNSLTLIWEFIGIASPCDLDKVDSDGQLTVEALKNCRKIAERINSVHPSSLGLHPVVYFYSQTGRHKPASFYAVSDLMHKLSENDGAGFVTFCKVRENLETLLIENDYIISQLVRRYRGALPAYPEISRFYMACINSLADGFSIAATLEKVLKENAFRFITKPMLEETDQSKDFSRDVKSAVYIKAALQGVPKCKICNGMLHVNSITTDHFKDQSTGGLGNEDNGRLTHPYCNTTLKKILAGG